MPSFQKPILCVECWRFKVFVLVFPGVEELCDPEEDYTSVRSIE